MDHGLFGDEVANPESPRPLRILLRDLGFALALGIATYVAFLFLNNYALSRGFTEYELVLLEAGAIVAVAYLVARAVTNATNAVLRRRGGASRAHLVRIFFNLLIGVAAVLALFKLAGVSIESIFLGSALAGIVLGLAAQTVLANVFAGLLLVVADPFRPGDRVTFVSSSYAAIWPSYPHELMYPGYSGVIEDVGLIYTVLRVETGGLAKVPNSVVLGALVLRPDPRGGRSQRVRMTFPLSVPVATVEAAVGELAEALARSDPAAPRPRFEVADIAAATWDGVVVLWTTSLDEAGTRDAVLRAVLAHLPEAVGRG